MPRFTVSNGLLEATHVKRIGPAIWEFMVLIDMQTAPDGTVNRGQPVTHSEIARRLGRGVRTVARNMVLLKPYLEIQKTRRGGQIIRIKNPKKAFSSATSGRASDPSSATSGRAKGLSSARSGNQALPHVAEPSLLPLNSQRLNPTKRIDRQVERVIADMELGD